MRLRLGATVAVLLAAGAAPGRAAELTRVATRGEPGNAFELHLSVWWDRTQERAQITREVPTGGGQVVDGDELRYTRTVNAIVARAAVALYEDLEVHFELPYVLADDRSWRFGLHGNAPTGGAPGVVSSIEGNSVDASGQTCADQNPTLAGTQCPLFPVAPSTTVYHGGRAGDLKAGVAWGIFSDKKDSTKPYWLVGLDVTIPTAALYDPAANRGTDWSSPYNLPSSPGPFGEKVWKWDLQTVLSKRLGPIDPYVKGHLTLMTPSSSPYSTCDHAQELATTGPTMPVAQMNSQAPAGCQAGGADTQAQLPWIAGLTFGMELVPYENVAEQQKVAIDLRLWGDYTSASRFYNELTDANGKLNWTDPYLTMGGFLGVYLQPSRWVSLNASASLSTMTDHYITGETLGRNRSWPALAAGSGITADPTLMNPNFDWRYDAPGRRFRLSEVALFELRVAGVLRF